jgi:ankyrin repeat protein
LSDQFQASIDPYFTVCIFGFAEIIRFFEEAEVQQMNEVYLPQTGNFSTDEFPLSQYRAPSTHVGMNGLHMAIYHGHRTVIDALSDKGVDFAKNILRGETPLHIAARRGHVDLIRLLIERGLTRTR